MEDIFQEVNKAKKLLSTLSDANNRELDTSKKLEQEKENLLNDIENIKKTKILLESEVSKLKENIKLVNDDILLLNKQKKSINNEYISLKNNVESSRKELTSLESKTIKINNVNKKLDDDFNKKIESFKDILTNNFNNFINSIKK